MSSHAIVLPAPPAGRPALIPRIDCDPRIVAFAQTAQGKVAILAVSAALLAVRGMLHPGFLLVVAGISFLPKYRWQFMAVSGLCWIPYIVKREPGTEPGFWMTAIWVSLIAGFGILLAAIKLCWPKGIVARNPRLTLLAIFAGALAVAINAPAGQAQLRSWSIVALLSACLWFLSYLLTESSLEKASVWRGAASLFCLWPGAAAVSTPFLKRPSQMRRMEAKNDEEFAVVQLKGIKLLAWSLLLSIAFALFEIACDRAGIPKLTGAIAASTAHHPYPCYLCWASLFAGFVDSMVSMAVWGNTVVAGCRLAGFKLLRNTWRPLESRTVVDLWNRYYYYFKELIADFFFFPVYTRCFKKHPRFRMFFATWVSVGIGIPLFHFIRDIHYVAELGLWRALTGFHVYMCYASMLAIGIAISQIRKISGRSRETRTLTSPLLSTAGVILFFCFLQIFDETRRTVPISEHLLFLTRLAGRMN